MIVFAAQVPHNPLLLHAPPHQSEILAALAKIKHQLLATAPEVICLVSAHAGVFPKTFSLAAGDNFLASFKEFGIVHAQKTYAPDRELNAAILRLAKTEKISCQRVATAELDYGSAIALHLLNISVAHKLVVIGTCQRSLNEHLRFGVLAKEVLHATTKRVALIITGDGSRLHSSDSPAGFSPHAATFDAGVALSITHRSITGLERVQREYPQADECILRPLACGYGILRHFPIASQQITHEIQHGVGITSALLFSESSV